MAGENFTYKTTLQFGVGGLEHVKGIAGAMEGVRKSMSTLDKLNAFEGMQSQAKAALTRMYEMRRTVDQLRGPFEELRDKSVAALGSARGELEKLQLSVKATKNAADALKKIEAFEAIKASTKSAALPLDLLAEKIRHLKAQLSDGSVGRGFGKYLRAELREAETAMRKLTKAKQELASIGVDDRNLGAAKARYQAEVAAADAAKSRIRELQQTIRELGRNGTAEFAAVRGVMQGAEAELAKVTAEFQRNKAAVGRSRDELKALGVDIKSIASEKVRIKLEIDAENAAADVAELEASIQRIAALAAQQKSDAYKTLGLRSIGQIKQDVVAVREAIQNLRQAKVGPQEMERAIESARGRLKALHDEMTSGAARAAAAQRKALAALRETQTGDAYKTLGLRNIGQVQADVLKVRAALSTLRASNAGPAELARASEAARSKLAALNAELRGVSAASAGAVRSATGDLLKMAAAAISVREALQGVQNIVNSGLQLEKQESIFAFAQGGDVEAAGRELAFARAESDRLGLSINTTAEQYAKLTAAARGTSLEGQALRDVFSGIAEAVAANKLSNDEFAGIMLATNQIINKGTVYAEELRGQFGERLPGAFKLAAQAMQVTEAQLQKLLENGQIQTAEFLPKFAEALRAAASGSLELATSSTQAQLNRLGNAFEDFKRQVGKSGLFEALNAEIDRFLEKLDKMASTGELQQFASDLAAIIGGAVELFGAVARAAVEFRDEIGLLAKALAGLYVGGKAIAGLKAMAVAFRATGAAAGAAAVGVGAFVTVAKRLVPVAIGVALIELAQALWEVAKAGQASGEDIKDWAAISAKLRAELSEFENLDILPLDQLRALPEAALRAYEEALKKAEKLKRAIGADFAQRGDTANASFYTDQADAYRRGIEAIEALHRERLDGEKALRVATNEVRKQMVSDLEAALAAEKTALDAANADLKRAVNERKRIAEQFRQLVQDVSAPKRGGEQSLVSVDQAVAKAERASAQAAGLTGDAAQRKAQEAVQLAEQAAKALRDLESEDAQRENRKYNAGDFKYLAQRLERAANQAAGVDEDVAKAKAAQAEATLKAVEARLAALKTPIPLTLETDPANLDAIRAAIEEKLRGITVQVTPAVGDAAVPDDTPKRAYGGPLPGYSPGDRSDNLLFWGTAGEWVLDRPTRRFYGDAFLRQLMSRQIPRFAFGGPLGGLEMPRLSEAAIAPAPLLQPMNVTVPGVGTYPVQASPDVAAQMERDFYLRALATGHRG